MSAVAYHLEDLTRDAASMLRDLANGNPPNLDAARELLKTAQTIVAAVEATKLVFAGGAVKLGDLVVVDDAGAQRAMAEQWAHDNERLEKARAEAGLTALLDDTAPAHSSDRDHRQSV